MMRMQLKWLALAVALTCGLGMAMAAHADTVITTFDNYALGGVYANWSDPNVTAITSNPTNYEIESLGFGGGYAGLDPFPTDASGETAIKFDVTIHSGDTPNVLALLEDGDGTQYLWRFQTLALGNHVMTAPIPTVQPTSGTTLEGDNYDTFQGIAGTTAGLDLSTLQFLQLQVDDHGSGVPYDICFNDLRLTQPVPEPASVAMLASGAIGLAWLFARRRRS